MKILAISDTPSKALWDYCTRERLQGIDLILSCGDLPKKYLEYLTNFTPAPILYVHGNHDGRYRHAGDLHDGSIRFGGARPYYTGIFHSGPITTELTAF